MSIEKRALGEAVRLARMKKALTQERLAEMLDITPIHLKNIEGSRRIPSVPLLFRMMELLDFSVDALVFPGQGGKTTRKNRYALGGHRPPRAYQNRGKVSSAPGPWSPPRP